MQANSLGKSQQSQWGIVWIVIGVFAVLSVVSGFVSEGFLEADACTHYIMSRFAFEEAHYIINIWGRPFCTGIYAIPALLAEREGVRIASMMIAVAIGLMTMNVARRQGYRLPVLALIFLLGQPLVFLHSFSELTELPFALLVALGLMAYQRKWWGTLAIVAGMMPLSRPEGFGFLLITAGGLLLHRKWWWMLVLPVPLVVWNYAGWVVDYKQGPWWMWLISHWPYAKESLYQSGPLWFFVGALPILTSPFVFPAAMVGWWRIWAEGLGRGIRGIFASDDDAHRRRLELIIAGLPAFVLVVHSLLYWQGKMASNGELRYLLVAAPMWALLGARGWEWLFDRFQFKRAIGWSLVAVVAPASANLAYSVVPLRFDGDWLEAREVTEWYQSTPLREEYPQLMVAHTGVYYFMDLSLTASDHVLQWVHEEVDKARPGTLMIWDSVYGYYNSDAKRRITVEHLRAAGWKELPWPVGEVRLTDKGEPAWRLFVTEPIGAAATQPLSSEPRLTD